MSIIRVIRQGERIEYRIVKRTGLFNRYRVQYRNPDALIFKAKWWQPWKEDQQWSFLMTSGLYHNYVQEVSSCHDAEAVIDADLRERIGMAEGWVPVSCAEEGARNH